MKTKSIIIWVVILILGIYGGVYYIAAKKAKSVVSSVAERDARMTDAVREMFPDEKR